MRSTRGSGCSTPSSARPGAGPTGCSSSVPGWRPRTRCARAVTMRRTGCGPASGREADRAPEGRHEPGPTATDDDFPGQDRLQLADAAEHHQVEGRRVEPDLNVSAGPGRLRADL